MSNSIRLRLQKLLLVVGVFFVAAVLNSCAEHKKLDSAATEGMNRETLNTYRQYMVHGETIYKRICQNCHMPDGNGLGGVIPPLRQSDYLVNNLNSSICGIKYGMEGEIVVNGTTYNQPMIMPEQLTPIEIAEVMTYITNTWGNSQGLITVEKVNSALNGCEKPAQ